MGRNNHTTLLRALVGLASVAGLICVFVFQQFNFAGVIAIQGEPLFVFFVNRSIRFLINDGLTLTLIWTLFYKKKYVVFALWVQIFGMVFILAPYFALKAYFPSYNGPLVSFMHRLILNPTLLLLLVPAFYYQTRLEKNDDAEV